jgi:hypothetical protein
MITMPIRIYLPTDRVVEGTLQIEDDHHITIDFPETTLGALRLVEHIHTGHLVGIMFSYLLAVPKKG